MAMIDRRAGGGSFVFENERECKPMILAECPQAIAPGSDHVACLFAWKLAELRDVIRGLDENFGPTNAWGSLPLSVSVRRRSWRTAILSGIHSDRGEPIRHDADAPARTVGGTFGVADREDFGRGFRF